MDPIVKLARATMNGDNEQRDKILATIGVEIKGEAKEYTGKALNKYIMQNWINAADTILEMMVIHLPSPKTAQKYRAGYLYEGPIDDDCGKAI